jgi:hypothetical protein
LPLNALEDHSDDDTGRYFRVSLKLKVILKAMLLYVTAVKGISASQLARTLGVAYQTAFVLLHKLRETLLVSRDLTQLSGTVHVDGAHFSGRMRKPRQKKKKDKNQHRWRQGRTAYPQHPNRRIVMALRESFDGKGKGARRTIVECVPAEDDTHVRKLAHEYIVPNSIVMTDESPAYNGYLKSYQHFTVNHSTEFATKEGVSNNQAESFFTRCRRLVVGQVHRITPKYMLDYMNEMAWREDRRRVSPKEQLHELLELTLTTRKSQWWRGYWQGKHRSDELVFRGDDPPPVGVGLP